MSNLPALIATPGSEMQIQSSHYRGKSATGARLKSRFDTHLLIQLVNEPILIVWCTAPDRAIGGPSSVVCVHAMVAALVEEAVEGRHTRNAG